jgi:hypothetical protein
MTTINDPIRQASMFTGHGLPDPRLFPAGECEHAENGRPNQWRKEVFSLAAFTESLSILRNVFRLQKS